MDFLQEKSYFEWGNEVWIIQAYLEKFQLHISEGITDSSTQV